MGSGKESEGEDVSDDKRVTEEGKGRGEVWNKEGRGKVHEGGMVRGDKQGQEKGSERQDSRGEARRGEAGAC